MIFQFQAGAPSPPGPETTVTADLFCMDGGWTYVETGTPTTITEISCELVAAEVPPCLSCDVNDIAFDEMGSIPAGHRDLDDSSGCLMVTAVCPASGTDTVLMIFNDGDNGPLSPPGSEITAALECVDGNWMYDIGGVPTIITAVRCTAL